MCLANLAPERGIANGTLGVMHSLKMSPKSAKKIHKSVKQQQQATPAAGSLIFLSEPPTHINISIPDFDKYVTPTADGGLEPWQRDTIAWGKANSCMPSANVFSIPAKSRKLLVATESGGKLKYHKSNVTLGFSFTVFKAQGQTFDRAICTFSDGRLTLPRVYVALSRVKRHGDIRILRGDLTAATRTKLKSLNHPDWLQRYFAGIDDKAVNGCLFDSKRSVQIRKELLERKAKAANAAAAAVTAQKASTRNGAATAKTVPKPRTSLRAPGRPAIQPAAPSLQEPVVRSHKRKAEPALAPAPAPAPVVIIDDDDVDVHYTMSFDSLGDDSASAADADAEVVLVSDGPSFDHVGDGWKLSQRASTRVNDVHIIVSLLLVFLVLNVLCALHFLTNICRCFCCSCCRNRVSTKLRTKSS